MKRLIGQVGGKTEALYFMQKGRCALCGERMHHSRGTAQHPDGWTEEHVTPKAQGGGRQRNIVLTHSRCNNLKGGDMPLPYLQRQAGDMHAVYLYLNQHKGVRLNDRQELILYGDGK